MEMHCKSVSEYRDGVRWPQRKSKLADQTSAGRLGMNRWRGAGNLARRLL